MNMPQLNLFAFAFVDPSLFLSTMTLKYGRHFGDNDGPALFSEPRYRDCQHIVLRGPQDWTSDDAGTETSLLQEWPSARQLLANVCSTITTQLAAENFQVGRAYVESVRPGGYVGWHADQSGYAKTHQRFRLLVSPCAGGCWYSGGENLAPGIGNLTYFNNRALNSVVNLGPVPQISLVVDIRKPVLQ